jgi:hypothetical protein
MYLPPCAGIELALYVDHCASGFASFCAWQDCRHVEKGSTTRTIGLDLGLVRVRVVIEKLGPAKRSL